MTTHENFCLTNAEYFQAVRGHDPRDRLRERFDTLADAVAFGETFGDGRTMIYAITDTGLSAHIRNA